MCPTCTRPRRTDGRRLGVGRNDEDRSANSPSAIADRGVPDAPFKKTWPELLLKRMIRYAAESGYDGISWTPGEQQADRYRLSKHIRALDAVKFDDGNYDLTARMPGGEWRDLGVKIPEAELPEYVGKELAQKIVAGAPEAGTGNRQHFSDIDLKVGGEGMKGFYDKMVPDMANKLGRPFGARVGEDPELKPPSAAMHYGLDHRSGSRRQVRVV